MRTNTLKTQHVGTFNLLYHNDMGVFLLLIVSFILIGCQQTPENKNLPINQPIKNTIVSQPWEPSLAPFIEEKHSENNILFLKLKNNSAISFENQLLLLVNALNSTSIPFKEIKITAAGEEDTLYSADLLLDDAKSFSKQQISKPEFIRRLAIQTIETVPALKKKVLAYRQSGDLPNAQNTLEKWVTLEPQSFYALSLLGNVLRDQKMYDKAIIIYKKLLVLDPNSLFAFHNLAFCFEKMGVFDEAINAYAEALKIDPNNLVILQQMSEAARKNGNFNVALQLIAKAKTIRPTSDLFLVEGNIYRDQKKNSAAAAAYAEGEKLASYDFRFLFNEILLDCDNKKFADAKKKYQDLQMKDPALAKELSDIEIFKDKPEGQ